MVQKFTAADFQDKVLGAGQTVVVDFYADWCVPCKMMAPVFEAVSGEFEGQMVFGKLNVGNSCGNMVSMRCVLITSIRSVRPLWTCCWDIK